MKRIYLPLLLLVLPIFYSCLFAQSTNDESQPYVNAVQRYHQFLYPESSLYSGRQYNDYAYTIQEGSPFFDAVPFQNGSVVFQNMLYKNVPIAYDIVTESIVIYDAQHTYKLILASPKVSRFITSGHVFINITKDSAEARQLRIGYYELLYAGKTRVLKKDRRTVQESLSSAGVKRYIDRSVDYYVRKDNEYHNVNTKEALFSLFKNERKQMKQLLRKKKLKFRHNKDEAIAQAAEYYDELNH